MAPPPEAQKRQLAWLCDLVASSLLPHLVSKRDPALAAAPRLYLTPRPSRRRKHPKHRRRGSSRGRTGGASFSASFQLNKEIRGWNQEEEEEEEKVVVEEQHRWSESDQVFLRIE